MGGKKGEEACRRRSGGRKGRKKGKAGCVLVRKPRARLIACLWPFLLPRPHSDSCAEGTFFLLISKSSVCLFVCLFVCFVCLLFVCLLVFCLCVAVLWNTLPKQQ